MKLIVGLGNPGKEYENTRHNAGFKFIDFLTNKLKLNYSTKFSSLFAEINDKSGEKIIFFKPQTFMNESGRAVLEASKFYKINPENIFIAFDDLDIRLSEFKIQKGHYPKIHNGVNDIINRLNNDQFTFIRIGVDDRDPIERKFMSGKNYVLQKTDINFAEIFSAITSELEKRFEISF